MKHPKAKDVDAYISSQAEPFQKTLEALRAIIRSEVPEAKELISYQIPCFKHHYMLVGFGVTKNACSFHTMNPELISKMKDELKAVKHSGATLYFPPGEPLPEALIRKIVRARVEENQKRAESRAKGKE